MRRMNRTGQVCAVITICVLAACTPKNHGQEVKQRQEAATQAAESPALVETTQASDAEGDRTIQPGVYHFKARVGRTMRMPHGKRKYFQGVFPIDGVPCVFSGYDQQRALRLLVEEVDEPLWFLQPGREIRIMLGDDSELTGSRLRPTGRKHRGFTLAVYGCVDGQLRFDLSTPVEDMGVPEVSEDEGLKATAPPNDAKHPLEPGVYHFKAKVVDVSIGPIMRNKSINGIAKINGRSHVYSGFDQNWAVTLRVIEIDKPVWFMQPGEMIRFMVHSPSKLFGESHFGVAGQVREFTFRVSLNEDGTPRFGSLCTPGGRFPHGVAPATTQPASQPVMQE